jgi:hypothetical protein
MISTFVAAVQTKLVAIGAWCTTVNIGPQYAQETGAPPRYTLVQLAETYAPPYAPGGNPRPLWDRHVMAEVQMWGTSVSTVEGMIDQWIIAMHRAAKDTSTDPHMRGSVYKMGRGRWDQTTYLDKMGALYVLGIEFLIPVFDRDWLTTAGQPPNEDTYTGEQIYTYPRAGTPLTAVANVARNDPAASGSPADEVTVSVPKP